ncbi:aminotransferase class I/II-fold pyridoxal phosphate-dependent enzyme [Anoxybacterium hadale]|uniref:Aminotransferase class I/II-fold pyridoxal phosphate-dependent enzyme n=1 Tax=Anoxybacterium hadale TaxID=3408580 RepID=A0ACD1AEL6_9FIRM|nr:aminotransferase class I/II-fold pyridoxal phosphate-dependent enzyme [Clostridiales bacterium]
MSANTSIHDFLAQHSKKEAVSFHMPGHKGSLLYKRFGFDDFLGNIMNYDITEIPGADNLFQTEGAIKSVQDRYAALYGCKKSYLLVNGSSGGNIAAILASVGQGKQLIMARNCHKSVFNALTLGGIKPVYVYPETIGEYGISGAIEPAAVEKLIAENPDAEAVFITSPNYYGICSDIKSIAQIAHHSGKILIVDEAHGAHLQFSKALPASALESGADLVINSTHKTLASLTQSAVLHCNSEIVDHYLLEDKLQCVQSTSPSYILMASLDINAKILERHRNVLMEEWVHNLDLFYRRISKIPGLKTMGQMEGLDWTKINFSLGALGISGAQLDHILMEEYNIFIELFTGDWVMAMSGIGNKSEDYDRLASALEAIAGKDHLYESNSSPNDSHASSIDYDSANERNDKKKGSGVRLTPPKQALMFDIPTQKKRVKLADSEGMICASSIIPYPPGIPLICPGERIEAEAIAYIQTMRELGEKVIGVNELGEVIVGSNPTE